MANFIKDLFNNLINGKPKPDPFDLEAFFQDNLKNIKQQYDAQDYVLFKDFYLDALLPALAEKGGARAKNMVAGMLVSPVTKDLVEGKTPSFTPTTFKQDLQGESILFLEDCYLPAQYLVDKMVGTIRLAKFFFKLDDKPQDVKAMAEGYLEALQQTKNKTVSEHALKNNKNCNFNEKGTALPFFQSTVELGNAFGFVMRPNKKNSNQNKGPRF